MQNKKILPKDIEEIVNEKGFYLYEFIKVKDVKNAIEKDFLKLLDKIGKYVIGFIFIIGLILTPFIGKYFSLNIIYFFIGILFLIIFFYLLFIGIKFSYFFIKNSHIVITDKYLILNGKILKYTDKVTNISTEGFSPLNTSLLNKELNIIEKIFERKLFNNSENFQLFNSLKLQFKTDYEKILNKKIGAFVIVLLALYSVYVFIISFLYLFGIFLVWGIGLFIMVVNKFIFIKLKHKILFINNLFVNIEKTGFELVESKKEIKKHFSKLKDKNWEKNISSKISDVMKKINLLSNKNIDYSISMKNEIQNSKYKDIINLEILNSWIKSQIYSPISEIKNIIELNLISLRESNKDLEKQINNSEEKLKNVLILQKRRIDLQIKNSCDNITVLNLYLEKLK